MAEIQIPQPNMSDGGASPSFMYSYIIFREWCAWSDRISNADNDTDEKLDRATAVLIAICPNVEKRRELWNKYTEEKQTAGAIEAASLTAGSLMSYLAEIMEFTTSSWGAF